MANCSGWSDVQPCGVKMGIIRGTHGSYSPPARESTRLLLQDLTSSERSADDDDSSVSLTCQATVVTLIGVAHLSRSMRNPEAGGFCRLDVVGGGRDGAR